MEISEFKKLKKVTSIGKFKVIQSNGKGGKTKRQCAKKGRMLVLSKGKYMVCAWVSYKGNVKGIWSFDRTDPIMREVNSKCAVCSIK